LNKGFEKVTGSILAWLNSDDKYHLGSFSVVAEIFSKFNEISWITGIPTAFDDLGRCVLVEPIRLWSKYSFYLGELAWIQQESTFWRRELWSKVDISRLLPLHFAGDFALWMLFFRYAKLYSINALLGGFRYRKSNQKTLDSMDLYLQEAKEILSQEILLLDANTKNHLNKMKLYQKLLRITKRLNINSLKCKYFSMFEYPDKILFDKKNYSFKLLKSTYFTEQIYSY
jgi:hypothetical protein